MSIESIEPLTNDLIASDKQYSFYLCKGTSDKNGRCKANFVSCQYLPRNTGFKTGNAPKVVVQSC